MPGNSPVESVSWINVVPLNRREKIARWWVEEVRQQHTYTSKRSREQEFMTHIGIDEIDALACDSLKEALWHQKQEREAAASFVSFPRATPDGSAYFGSIGIPSRPFGVTFTERGLMSHDDENH